MSALPSRVLRRFLEAVEKSAPQKVEPYFKKVKKQNPGYSDAQAWATAWSIYCKHKNPSDESCHQEEYFPGRSKKASPAYDKKRMSVLFVSEKRLPLAVAREVGTEQITIQNLEPYEEADVPLRVLDLDTHEPTRDSLTETRVDLEYPVGSGDSAADVASLVRQVLGNIGKKHGAKVEPCASSYHPNPRPASVG
jgi:hypothetical protein